jgi:hypothetical protein
MGAHTNGRLSNTVSVIATLGMGCAALALAATLL